ncbi:MAG: hypothetical protein AB7O57_07040 [Hyphomicrobiaceae bacterium]
MARQLLGLALVGLAVLPGVASGGEVTDEAAARHVAIIEAQHEALVSAMEAGPLVLRRALLVAEQPNRYGEYVPRADRPFALGEAMHVYLEPFGLVHRRDGDVWRLDVMLGLAIEDEAGRSIVHEPEFGGISIANRERRAEVMTYLSLNVADAPAGRYVLVVSLRDRVSAKTARVRLPFSVAGDGGGAVRGPSTALQ